MEKDVDTHPTTIVWYRLDLRTDDHRPLEYAAQRGRVVPVYIIDTTCGSDFRQEQVPSIGKASQWWLHHSLRSLSQTLEHLGSPLILRVGHPLQVLGDLCQEVGADQIAIHESTDPVSQGIEDSLDDQLDQAGIELIRFSPDMLWTVGSVLSGAAKPYQVFTPFWNRACKMHVDEPICSPTMLLPPVKSPEQVTLCSLDLVDSIDWASGFRDRWSPGEPSAKESFSKFVAERIDQYHLCRDQMSEQGWSELSAPIHFGELSVRCMWHTLTENQSGNENPGVAAYLRQLGWRDFAIHLMNHFPHTIDLPFRNQFEQFPWVTNNEHFLKWKRGMTGYPVVDAAMRNLWAEGWMPNRARMIVASFLCKDLLISWKEGADWFWDTLVDADLANNTFGWQWTAGCGADAAPYFRVFNPVCQGKKFDPNGDFVRRWIPELAALSSKDIHTPWEASEQALRNAGVVLGIHYPHRMVDHAQARVAALDAYASISR